jgi:hypothetical protein
MILSIFVTFPTPWIPIDDPKIINNCKPLLLYYYCTQSKLEHFTTYSFQEIHLEKPYIIWGHVISVRVSVADTTLLCIIK